MNDQVILQRLSDFTVAICRDANDPTTIIGTGVFVSVDGLIMTCAHVMKSLGVDPRTVYSARIGVYFPRARSGRSKGYWATIDACSRDYDDDIVLLRLIDSDTPLDFDQRVATLGCARRSEGHAFRSHGYCLPIENPDGYLEGTIHGPAIPDSQHRLRVGMIALRATSNILPGHSGAAVLDIKRNLVVGLIATRWENGEWGRATDCHVLIFPPFGLTLHEDPLDNAIARRPRDGMLTAVQAIAASDLHLTPYTIPSRLPENEWVERRELLNSLHTDWANPEKRVTELVGFGGEGKSSLARHWIDELQTDGIFWWDFYNRRSVYEFFEAALTYLSGGRINLRKLLSPSQRIEMLAAMLKTGRYLFVLDGLEVIQYQQGDNYGDVVNTDLQTFLEFMASPYHQSFCLITSRIPLNLRHYTTFSHHDVNHLSTTDGRALLRNLGISGGDADLDQVVIKWDGHALTLSLLGSYLHEQHKGKLDQIQDMFYIEDISPRTNDNRMQQINRLLRHYDTQLNELEKIFLLTFSAFRLPVPVDSFEHIFGAQSDMLINVPLYTKDITAFAALLEQLKRYRILRYDEQTRQYTAHPLVRDHYYKILHQDLGQACSVHEKIKNYYLTKSRFNSHVFTLSDLTPLIEAIHHACQAKAYDQALILYQEDLPVAIDCPDDFYNSKKRSLAETLKNQFGAYDVALSLLKEFFTTGKVSGEPQINKKFVLEEVGFCLMNLGRLEEATDRYQQVVQDHLEAGEWEHASSAYQQLAKIQTHMGKFEDGADNAQRSLDLVVSPTNPKKLEEGRFQVKLTHEYTTWALLGYIDHMQGRRADADLSFNYAQYLHKTFSKRTFLVGPNGILHAKHLQKNKRTIHARRIIKNNLKVCQDNNWNGELSQCHYILGCLDARSRRHKNAQKNFDQAVEIARNLSRRDVLIEALSARGRWIAQRGKGETAYMDLVEALDLARTNGYRVYEVDIRVGLAWMYRASGQLEEAQREAEQAQQMSEEMGYYWGKVEAQEMYTNLT